LKEASYFAPGHLTGLFQICDEPENPILKGARGSGVSITLGVHSKATVEPAEKTTSTIYINEREAPEAIVSKNVLGKYIQKLSTPKKITINHKIETPITAGFGSSGSGAISLSLALNDALRLGLTRIEATRIAHIAEIECKTGLGSVFAADKGGFGVLYKPGAPGIGEGKFYQNCEDYRVVYLYFGPIPTKEALSNPELRHKINELGGQYVDELYRELTPERFLKFSRSFSEHVGLITPNLRRVLDATDHEGYQCTMAMFGEVVFSVQPKEEALSLHRFLKSLDEGYDPVICKIDTLGTRKTEN
jgi:pantoate kinase